MKEAFYFFNCQTWKSINPVIVVPFYIHTAASYFGINFLFLFLAQPLKRYSLSKFFLLDYKYLTWLLGISTSQLTEANKNQEKGFHFCFCFCFSTMDKFNFVRNGMIRLPPGFRFQPTDEELVFQYLRCKVFSCPLPASIIPEVNVCMYDPWDLPG